MHCLGRDGGSSIGPEGAPSRHGLPVGASLHAGGVLGARGAARGRTPGAHRRGAVRGSATDRSPQHRHLEPDPDLHPVPRCPPRRRPALRAPRRRLAARLAHLARARSVPGDGGAAANDGCGSPRHGGPRGRSAVRRVRHLRPERESRHVRGPRGARAVARRPRAAGDRATRPRGGQVAGRRRACRVRGVRGRGLPRPDRRSRGRLRARVGPLEGRVRGLASSPRRVYHPKSRCPPAARARTWSASRTRSPRSAPAAWSSSWTTRIARTRATSASRPSASRPSTSTSWPPTGAGSGPPRTPGGPAPRGAPGGLPPGGGNRGAPPGARHRGAAPPPGGFRAPPRTEDRAHPRPDRVPEPPRLARAPHGRGAHHDPPRRRLPRPRLHHRRGRGRAPRAGEGRHPRRRADARAHAPRVPAGRRLRLPRARHAESPPEGDGAHRRRGQGRDPLPPPRCPRPRPLLGAARRQRARAEHRARRLVARELPRVRHRGADPARRGRGKDPLADEPPLAPGQPAWLRARDRRFRAAHARRPGAQLRGGARAEAVQGPLRSGAMRRAGAVAVLVGLSVAVSAAPPPEDVVRAKLTASGGQAVVEATIAPGWHVNAHQPRDEFLIPTTVTLTPPAGVRAGAGEYPPPVEKRLGFSGGTTLLLYDGTVRFTATLEGTPAAGGGPLKAAPRFQAGDDSRCLPPRTLEMVAALDAPAPLGAAEPPSTGQNQVAGWIARWGLPLTFLWIALVGVALNLTPCVYPLISVTVAFFGGRSGAEEAHTLRRALLYVLGICLTFSTLGVTAALTGSLFGSALQRPAVLAAIALALVGLAGSNFGFYQLRVPSPLVQRLGRVGEGDLGAFFMGLTMGGVAAPCIGPAVLALLLFVGAQQSVALGFALFFMLGLGLGAPYLALAAVAGRRPGAPPARGRARGGGGHFWL